MENPKKRRGGSQKPPRQVGEGVAQEGLGCGRRLPHHPQNCLPVGAGIGARQAGHALRPSAG